MVIDDDVGDGDCDGYDYADEHRDDDHDGGRL